MSAELAALARGALLGFSINRLSGAVITSFGLLALVSILRARA